MATGQPVYWPHAPLHLAQVDELRRTHVRLVYVCKTGTVRRPVVPVELLAALQRRPDVDLPLPVHNPLGRGCLARSKQFKRSEE